MTNLNGVLKISCSCSQSYDFSCSHARMLELDYKEDRATKYWCFWIAALEKTLESPTARRANQSILKGNQPWLFIGRTDVETEAPILWPPDAKSWLIGKDPDAGKDGRQKEKFWWRMKWLDSITNSMDMHLSKLQETVEAGVLQCIRLQQLSDWIKQQIILKYG